MTNVRVLVVDDHPIFRLGLAASLQDMDGVELVGEGATVSEVPELLRTCEPDVVLLDLNLPDGSGLETNRWLAQEHPGVKVVMLTMSEDHHAAAAAIQDGACGYIVKGADPARVEHALRAVMAGDVVLDSELAGSITRLARVRAAARTSPFPQLSPREYEILELVACGFPNARIAAELHLAEKTVRNNVSNILSKIGAESRAGAVVLAHRHGVGLDR